MEQPSSMIIAAKEEKHNLDRWLYHLEKDIQWVKKQIVHTTAT